MILDAVYSRVGLNPNINTTYDHVFGDFPATIFYTPYISYGSGQPYDIRH